MVCIYCNGNVRVSNSRPQKSRNQVWRRRPCKACGAVFTTIEAIDLSQALTVSRQPENSGKQPRNADSNRNLDNLEPFDRDRLFISLYESLRHRPTASRDARGLADTVVAHIIPKAQNGLVTVRTIAAAALNTLQRFDTAAATHYAAFHGLS